MEAFFYLVTVGGRICIPKQDLWLLQSQMDRRICSKSDNAFIISDAIILFWSKNVTYQNLCLSLTYFH